MSYLPSKNWKNIKPTKQILAEKLSGLKAYKKDRLDIGVFVCENDLSEALIALRNYNNPDAHKACWIMEQCFLIDPVKYYPRINARGELLTQPIVSGGKRSLLAIVYRYVSSPAFKRQQKNLAVDKVENSDLEFLDEKAVSQIVAACFDELIASDKSANLAYSIYILQQLGKSQPWILEELHRTLIYKLEKDSHKLGRGFIAAANKVLKSV